MLVRNKNIEGEAKVMRRILGLFYVATNFYLIKVVGLSSNFQGFVMRC